MCLRSSARRRALLSFTSSIHPKTADVQTGCYGCIPEWSHLWEHYGCTQDQVDLRSSQNQVKELAPSETSRFTPEIQTNASTRAHYVEFHMSGCMSTNAVEEQFGHLLHQFLKADENAVQEKVVMREAAAVRNEANRALSAIPYMLSELSKMVDLRHHLSVIQAVIGRNVLGEGSENNMSDIEDQATVMREMKHCADTMVPSRTSWVYHGPARLMSLDMFKDFAAKVDDLMKPKAPETPDEVLLTPLVKEEYIGALWRMCVLPNENGFNVLRILSRRAGDFKGERGVFTGAASASERRDHGHAEEAADGFFFREHV